MNIKSLSNEIWLESEMGNPIFLCQTPFSVANIEEILGILFKEGKEGKKGGLGTDFYSFISIDDKQIMFKGYDDRNRKEDLSVCAYMHCTEPSPRQLIELLTKSLSIDECELLEFGGYLESPKYVLSRLDDNRNELEIARFHNVCLAEHLKKCYEDKGHKQDYYVQEVI